jgi:3-oxoacyl-[acyl-carrier-protein] synthase II
VTGIVVTGIGLVTPLGLGREATWAAARAGATGIRPLAPPLRGVFGCHYGAPVVLPSDEVAGTPGPAHAMALRCAREALADAGLAPGRAADLPIVIGNSTVEHTLERKRALWRERTCAAPADGAGAPPAGLEEFALAAWLRARLGVRGPVTTLASNCVAGLQAIILGGLHVAAGRRTRVLAGGVDRTVTPEMLARFALLQALARADDPAASRPFDERHAGMVLGDGAGLLVLEAEAAARARGARVYARLAGWGMTSDHHHPTRGAPDARAKAAAVRDALARAALAPAAVDCVSAHGTGTVDNDESEIRALRLALGPHAERVPITAAKSALGHSLAASGGVETALALLTVRDGVVPPILNLVRPAAACRVEGLVRRPLRLRARTIVKTAFAFGGFNACVVLAAEAAPRRRGEAGA